MAKLYYADTKNRPVTKKSKLWTPGRKYKWAFWTLLVVQATALSALWIYRDTDVVYSWVRQIWPM